MVFHNLIPEYISTRVIYKMNSTMKRINTEFEDAKLFKLNYADSKLATNHQ